MGKKIKAILVVGARPNFMKAAPVLRAMKKSKKFQPILLHTGQHSSKEMSGNFFSDLGLGKPDIYLSAGGGTILQQTAKIMELCEESFVKIKPDLVVVFGDVTSTLSAGLCAKKLNIPLAHVEAGLRSFDRSMPEEVNRILTDNISDFLFVTEKSGVQNLKKEGIASSKIHFVGNTMIDTLVFMKKKISNSKILKKFSLRKGNYAVLTLHRPSNVDDPKNLRLLLGIFKNLRLLVIFPVHPRTRKNLPALAGKPATKNIICVEPLGYVDFIKLVENSKCVFTDSGGIQEETTFLGIPCVTLRENTERPATVFEGTNILVGTNPTNIKKAISRVLFGKVKKRKVLKYWDGKAAERISQILARRLK